MKNIFFTKENDVLYNTANILFKIIARNKNEYI